jgi:NhaP-type Na+/H+ or K+/H+ antiporter
VEDATYWIAFTANQIVLGPVVGIAVGYLGAKLLQSANQARWINEVFLKLSAVGLALFGFGAAELLHGNGFIAAFAAGLMMGNVARDICPKLYQFGEVEGQLLSLLTFMIFGGLMVPEWLGAITWKTVIYALLSLTLIRALPVAVSLVGLKLQAVTVLFLGWFGPRGIASILYALLIFEESTFLPTEALFTTVTLTVLFSIFLHGLTAHPGAKAYAAALESMPETELPEHQEIVEMPLRLSTMK